MVDVYADLLFLINWGMDGLCLCLTGRLLHRPLRPLRLGVAAALGGVYAVLALLPEVGWGMALLWDVGVCVLMCGLAFGGRGTGGVGGLLSTAAVYTALSLGLGGIMTGLFNLANRAGLDRLLPAGEEGLTAWLFALLAGVSGGVTLLWGRFLRRRTATRSCVLTVEHGGKTLTLRGLVDTGNLLRDPVGGRPVICVSRRRLEGMLSPALSACLQGDVPADLPPEEAAILRVIPAVTAAGETLLYGFRPHSVTLSAEGRRGERVSRVDVILAAADGLTEADALVPAELLRF